MFSFRFIFVVHLVNKITMSFEMDLKSGINSWLICLFNFGFFSLKIIEGFCKFLLKDHRNEAKSW